MAQTFSEAFTAAFQPAAQRGQQQMQFNEQMALKRRAQEMQRKVQRAQIDRIRQKIDRGEKLLPHEVELAKQEATNARRRGEGQRLKNEGQRINNDIQQTRQSYLPQQMEANLDRTRAATDASKAQAGAARSRGRLTGMKADEIQRQIERRKAIRNQQQQLRGGVQADGEVPEAASPVKIPDTETMRKKHYALGPMLFQQAVGAGLDMIGLDTMGDAARRGLVYDLPKDRSSKGKAFVGASAAYGRKMRRQFEKAYPEARDPNVAKQVYTRLARSYQALRDQKYNLPEEERKKLMGQMERDMQYFQSQLPQQNPIGNKLMETGNAALDEEDYGAAVRAYDSARKVQGGQ